MSVIIRGIEMPKNCALCKFRGAGETWCPFTLRDVPGNTIPEDCPVGYVPPHGRLIDADALYPIYADLLDGGDVKAVVPKIVIDTSPTIIPAEEVKI